MKIECHCGAVIVDAESSPHKAQLIPDQEFFQFLDAIDAAIEKNGPSAGAKEAACMAVRTRISKLARQVWQCSQCSRLYVDNASRELRCFEPREGEAAGEVFRSRG